MRIPFVTPDVFEGHYPINWYYQREGWNGRPALLGTPGLLLWCDTTHGAEVRGLQKLTSSIMYSVVGNQVFSHGVNGSSTQCTGTLNTTQGAVQMATNGTYVMIVDKVHGYYVSGTTVTEITDADFPIPSSLTYQDGYFIVTEKDTGRFYISALNLPSSWNSLDYTTAEGLPDYAVRAFMYHRELLNFQEDSIEPYYNSGNPDFPFERIQGTFIETGLGARDSVAKTDNSVLWLNNNFVINRMQGYIPVIVSRETWNGIVGAYTTKTDAFAYVYRDRGNSFYVLTFPSENVTWVLNATTGAIHQWASGTTQARHRSNCHCWFANKNLVGDFGNGKIYELSNTIYTDDGDTIRRTRVAPPLFDPETRNRITYNTVEIEFKTGVGLSTGQGDNPQAMFRYSSDGARTWSSYRFRPIGKIGKYKDRARWTRIGSHRTLITEISLSDPIEPVIVGAYADVTRNRV